jgi:hypothetical protein
MKVDQDFSAAIFNADFEKAARLIVSGKNMNGVSSKKTALQLARRAKRSDVVALLLRCGLARLLSLDAQIAVVRCFEEFCLDCGVEQKHLR